MRVECKNKLKLYVSQYVYYKGNRMNELQKLNCVSYKVTRFAALP
jgi:hypothetical protein